MTWAIAKSNPLFLYPALGLMSYNYSSETAWAGNDWLAETSTPARDSGQALYGTYSIKFTGGADQSALNRFTYDSSIWGAVNAGPYSFYCWVYPTAYTGAAKVRLILGLTKAAGVALTTPSSTTADFDLSTLTLNSWNMLRVVAPELTAAQQAEFVSVDLRVQMIVGGGTGTFYSDGHHFGYALDFQDLTGASPTSGAWIKDKLTVKKSYARTVVTALNGTAETLQWNAGLQTVSGETTLLSDADRTKWRTFWGRTNGRMPFTFLANQSTITRDYVAQAVHTGLEDGLTQYPGTALHRAKFEFEEVT